LLASSKGAKKGPIGKSFGGDLRVLLVPGLGKVPLGNFGLFQKRVGENLGALLGKGLFERIFFPPNFLGGNLPSGVSPLLYFRAGFSTIILGVQRGGLESPLGLGKVAPGSPYLAFQNSIWGVTGRNLGKRVIGNSGFLREA